MDLQLGDVLAGLARRPGKPQHQRLVDRLPGGIAQQRARRLRGSGSLPASASAHRPARGPDMRTTAIALGGRPEERAKMVWSRGCMAYLSG